MGLRARVERGDRTRKRGCGGRLEMGKDKPPHQPADPSIILASTPKIYLLRTWFRNLVFVPHLGDEHVSIDSWPLLARDIKAAGLGIVRLLTNMGHAFSYQAICCYLLSGPKYPVDYHPQIPNAIRFITKNSFGF